MEAVYVLNYFASFHLGKCTWYQSKKAYFPSGARPVVNDTSQICV